MARARRASGGKDDSNERRGPPFGPCRGPNGCLLPHGWTHCPRNPDSERYNPEEAAKTGPHPEALQAWKAQNEKWGTDVWPEELRSQGGPRARQLTINRSSSLYVPALVGKVKTQALVDTGCELDIMSDELYHRLNPRPQLKTPDFTTVQDFAKRPLNVLGKCQIELTLCNPRTEDTYTRQIEMHVVAGLKDPMLLGFNGLRWCAQAIKLDGELMTLTFRPDVVPDRRVEPSAEVKADFARPSSW